MYEGADAVALRRGVGGMQKWDSRCREMGEVCQPQQPNIFGFNGDKSPDFGPLKHRMLEVRIPRRPGLSSWDISCACVNLKKF